MTIQHVVEVVIIAVVIYAGGSLFYEKGITGVKSPLHQLTLGHNEIGK